jgi:methylated-DNA-[protein]-cysteine S-methyltransferase
MPPLDARPGDSSVLADARAQLTAYFAGTRVAFDLPLAPLGTPFQQRVWEELLRIPPATTRTYGELAARLGRPHAARAVGTANAKNPISIVVPCHRVIGAGGALTGYAGGLPAKRWLLDHERAVALSSGREGQRADRW